MTATGIEVYRRGENVCYRVRAMPAIQATLWYDEHRYWVDGPEGERARFSTPELAGAYAEGLLGVYMRAERCPRLLRNRGWAIAFASALLGAFTGLTLIDTFDLAWLGYRVNLAPWEAACLVAAICVALTICLLERGVE